jgi:hypothetical protein
MLSEALGAMPAEALGAMPAEAVSAVLSMQQTAMMQWRRMVLVLVSIIHLVTITQDTYKIMGKPNG